MSTSAGYPSTQSTTSALPPAAHVVPPGGCTCNRHAGQTSCGQLNFEQGFDATSSRPMYTNKMIAIPAAAAHEGRSPVETFLNYLPAPLKRKMNDYHKRAAAINKEAGWMDASISQLLVDVVSHWRDKAGCSCYKLCLPAIPHPSASKPLQCFDRSYGCIGGDMLAYAAVFSLRCNLCKQQKQWYLAIKEHNGTAGLVRGPQPLPKGYQAPVDRVWRTPPMTPMCQTPSQPVVVAASTCSQAMLPEQQETSNKAHRVKGLSVHADTVVRPSALLTTALDGKGISNQHKRAHRSDESDGNGQCPQPPAINAHSQMVSPDQQRCKRARFDVVPQSALAAAHSFHMASQAQRGATNMPQHHLPRQQQQQQVQPRMQQPLTQALHQHQQRHRQQIASNLPQHVLVPTAQVRQLSNTVQQLQMIAGQLLEPGSSVINNVTQPLHWAQAPQANLQLILNIVSRLQKHLELISQNILILQQQVQQLVTNRQHLQECTGA